MGSVGCVSGVPGHADGQWWQCQGNVEEVQSEGAGVVGEGLRGSAGKCGGYEADDVAAAGEGHRGQMAGGTTLTRRWRFCSARAVSRGPVNRPRRPTATCWAAAKPGWGQRPFGERMAGPDGRHHAEAEQFFDPGFGVHVVDGSDLQVDPAIAQGGSGFQFFGPDPERDPRRLPLGRVQQSGGQCRADQVGGLEGEGAAEAGGVDARARAEQRSETAYDCGGFLAQGLGAWGGNHGLSGPDQAGVLESAPVAGEELRVIVRDPARLPVAVRGRVEVVTGSHAEAEVLDRAFEGADAVFWLVPPDAS